VNVSPDAARREMDVIAAMAPSMAGRRFDLNLFLELNHEYHESPVVPRPRSMDDASLSDQAVRRAASISRRVPIDNKRILEIGCGRAHLGRELAERHKADYVGVDVSEYDTWQTQAGPRVRLIRRDLSTEPSSDLGKFDVIVSLAALEHVVHPYSMLQAIYQRLRPGGVAYLAANLYRGPKASHRYRQVYFPWPHLLFSDDVWREFYRRVHNRDETFAWVNKITYAQYLTYFDRIGFEQSKVWLSPSTFDAEFYARFEEVLSAYPIFDLSHDFVYAVLCRPRQDGTNSANATGEVRAEIERLSREIDALRSSRSWRITAPLRKVSRLIRRLR
jgi:2-polyprenyl-3-methyl-5-hydroxy-6-metoxy-1,4-benzoquinol methylase